MLTAEQVREIIRDELPRKRSRGIDRDNKRPQLVCRVLPSELPIIDAACEQRGITRSQFIREALSAALGTALQPRQPIPPGLKRNTSRLSERLAERRALLARDAAVVQGGVRQTPAASVPKLRGPQRPE